MLPGHSGESVARGVVFEATAAGIFRIEGLHQPHPADGAGDVAVAAQDPAFDEDAGADTGSNGEENGILAALRRALPGFAEDIAGTVAVDADGHIGKGPAQLPHKRVLGPAGNIGRPDCSLLRIIDARDADADGVDRVASGHHARRLCDERAYAAGFPARQRHILFAQNRPMVRKNRGGELGAAQVQSEDFHRLDSSRGQMR